MAMKVLRQMTRLGYHYVDTTYDDDFIYDIYENDTGIRKSFIVGTI